jgi:hypothetical protein
MADDLPEVTAPSKLAFKRVRAPQKRAFLWAYAQTGRICDAARAIEMSTDIHYHWLKDEVYAEEFKKAQLIAGNKFEDEIFRRAFNGIDKPLVYQGQISKDENGKPVTVKEYSDLLAIFALKGIFPDKYRDNQPGVNFQGPTQINVTIKNESSLPSPQDFISCNAKKEEED